MCDKRNRSRRRTARLVKVAHDGIAAYARCSDLSDTGLKLALTAPLSLNDRVAVALSPAIVFYGTVAWVTGSECGIAFDNAIDSTALIEALDEPPATTLDMLGIRGPMPLTPTPVDRQVGTRFRPGLAVTVMTGPDSEQRGVVRWAKDNVAALELVGAPRPEPQLGLLPPPDRP
jgi:hypothetical protein